MLYLSRINNANQSKIWFIYSDINGPSNVLLNKRNSIDAFNFKVLVNLFFEGPHHDLFLLVRRFLKKVTHVNGMLHLSEIQAE